MKKIKYLLPILVILCTVFYYSCDDSGQLPTDISAGQIVFTQTVNLMTLDPADGQYHMWILVRDTTGIPRILNLGRFNVNGEGALVDGSGNPVTLKLNDVDTVDIARAEYCIVTIEPVFATVPGRTVILAGSFTSIADSVSAPLKMSDPLALGSTGDTLLKNLGRLYIINTPTNGGVNCNKGMWFCDTSGNSYLPNAQLDPGGGWQYRGWVHNKVTNVYTTTGAFFNPLAADLDGAGPCRGDSSAYNAPGQDWVIDTIPGCGGINLTDGNYEVFIELEPKDRIGALPFGMKIYWQNIIIPNFNCRRLDNLFSQFSKLPRAYVRISK
ncbi:MAG: hypothetical protein IT281_06840 [Ignavibacteria bacterium]|nr:hypothetical protein [Ignavibacteria bacterium]